MNRHLKRGLVASLITFSLVAIAGALDMYFDPPVDVPSVGYYALGWLVKALLAFSLGVGFITFTLVGLGSAIVANTGNRWVKLSLFGVILLFSSAYYYFSQPPKYANLNQEKQFTYQPLK